jgi:pSer/pThr/pTyr-binding forkhead associated (FHA) protein
MFTHVILTATAGTPKPRDFFFQGQEQVLIGRSTGCDLRVDDPTVSRRHSLIDTDGEAVWVRDLDSLNGTYINGEKVARSEPMSEEAPVIQPPKVALKDGDEVRMGNHVFRVRLETVNPPEAVDTRPLMPDQCAECA